MSKQTNEQDPQPFEDEEGNLCIMTECGCDGTVPILVEHDFDSNEEAVKQLTALYPDQTFELMCGDVVKWVECDCVNGLRPMIIRRSDESIGTAIDRLVDIVWYNRCHVPMFENINLGIETCDPEIWKGALLAAEKVRARYDVEGGELGPFGEFEWGMICGKLSALRWVLGSYWDDLDT
jgi:hypothetical protein